MGCGCFPPLSGGRRTQRVQSYEGNAELDGSTPDGGDGLPAPQEKRPGVKPEFPIDVNAHEEQPDKKWRRESGGKEGAERGSSSFKAASSETAEESGVEIDSAPAENSHRGEEITSGRGAKDAGRVNESTRKDVQKGKGKPRAVYRAEVRESVFAVPSEVAASESTEAITEKAVRIQERSPSDQPTEDRAGVAGFGESLEREINAGVSTLENGLTSWGQADPPELASLRRQGGLTEAANEAPGNEPAVLASDEGSMKSNPDASPASLRDSQTPNPEVVAEGLRVLASNNATTAPSNGQETTASRAPSDPPSMSPISASSERPDTVIGEPVDTSSKEPTYTPSESDKTTPVVWHENSMAVPGPVDKDAASAPKQNASTPRSAEKNRASTLQQAFVVADLGFQMEPVRKERPTLELDINGGVPVAAQHGGGLTRGPSALEQLSLLQLDVDDDLLSDLSPRAESVWTPDTARTGIVPRRPFAPWEASESESPGKESSFLSDGSENGSVDRAGFGGAGKLHGSEGVVSPVQAALRLIKRSQKLTSPTRKSNRSLAGSFEGAESGTDRSGCDREGDSDGSKGAATKNRGPGVVPERALSGKQKPEALEKMNGGKDVKALEKDASKVGVKKALSLKVGSTKRDGQLVGGGPRAVESESSPASSPVKASPGGNGSPVGSDVSNGSRRANGTKTGTGRRTEAAQHLKIGATNEHTGTAANKSATRVASLDLRAVAAAAAPARGEEEKRSLSRSASSRRATGPAAPAPVTSPEIWRQRKVELRQDPAGKPAGDLDEARWLRAGRASDFLGAHDRDGRPALKASGEATEHWHKIMASLKQPNLSWREKLSQLEESVHLFSDASGLVKFALRGEKSQEMSVGKAPLEPKTTGTGSTEKARGTTKVQVVSARPANGKRESDRGVSTGLAAQGEKALGRSTTTPSKRGAWKEEGGRGRGRAELKSGELLKTKGVTSADDGARSKAATDAKKSLVRAKSAPRERRERPDPSAAKGSNQDLESKELWLAAEDKRIKEEAVRLAGLAASLERETERLERQRAQAEKLERDMRARFGTAESRTDRPPPHGEGLSPSDRWNAPDSHGVGMLKRQSSRRGLHREETATSLSSDAALLSPPRARSQPGSRASSRPRSRKGEDRASRSARDDDSSSSGTGSNRSARTVRRKKLERSRSAGRLRVSEIGRDGSEKGFSGGEPSGRKSGAKAGTEAEKRAALLRQSLDNPRAGWVGSPPGRMIETRNVLSKAGLQRRTGKPAQGLPPGDARQENDSLETLYRVAVGSERSKDDSSSQRSSRAHALHGSRADAAAPREAASSPASSLSSKSGSASAGERNRKKTAESKQDGREIATRVEKKVPARARAADWVETDAETDMEEVRRKLRRKDMQEMAELVEFEEIEKTVMGV